MAAALGHGEFDAVEALIRRGAEVDLPVATATGRTETALGQIGAASPDERHRSMAYASQFGRIEILRALLESGEDPSRFNPIGCHSHSTPLHQAALAGHLEAVRLLVEFGADAAIKDIMFGGTPSGWAEHTGQKEIVEFLNNL